MNVNLTDSANESLHRMYALGLKFVRHMVSRTAFGKKWKRFTSNEWLNLTCSSTEVNLDAPSDGEEEWKSSSYGRIKL